MKHLIVLLLAPSMCFGYPLNPTFETQSSDYGAILIDWKTVDDPEQVCAQGKKSRNTKILACSIRRGLRCTIYTKRALSLALLGHEIRHCYEGDWHGPKEYLDLEVRHETK